MRPYIRKVLVKHKRGKFGMKSSKSPGKFKGSQFMKDPDQNRSRLKGKIGII
jgi:hypothetical protein